MELINVCVSRKREIRLKYYTHFDIFFIYIPRRLLSLLAHKSISMELTRKGADILDLDIQLTAVYLFRWKQQVSKDGSVSCNLGYKYDYRSSRLYSFVLRIKIKENK